MKILKRVHGRNIYHWTDNVPVEPEAWNQMCLMSDLPVVFKHIAIMPDCHVGKGALVGSVIPTKNAIIPSAVGVDIGCGMMAVRTTLTANDLPDTLKQIREAIENEVPCGEGRAYDKSSSKRTNMWNLHFNEYYDYIIKKYPKIEPRNFYPSTQLGTLGGGNHFIELCLDENNDVWIMLHSGSRGIGNKIGNQFIYEAKEYCAKNHIELVDRDLCWLTEGTEVFTDYVQSVTFSQEYARINRELMMEGVISVLKEHFPTFALTKMAVNCHHNYVELENHYGEDVFVTRKGAVSAREGQLGIIPGSMGAKSFIVRGKGNAESFHSCSHGAGRRMSRSAAKKIFTLEDHARATEGVECRQDMSVLDETPMSYKSIDDVMSAQEELVDVVHTLKQVVCVKG